MKPEAKTKAAHHVPRITKPSMYKYCKIYTAFYVQNEQLKRYSQSQRQSRHRVSADKISVIQKKSQTTMGNTIPARQKIP